MPDIKFSQFVTGGEIQSGDILVGLRGGVNTKFTSPADPGSEFLLKAKNFSDVENAQVANENIGFGTGAHTIITDADFSGGIYQIANPGPEQLTVITVTPGLVVRLPDSQSAGAYKLGQGPIILNAGLSNSVDVQMSDGSLLFTLDPNSAIDFSLVSKSTVPGTWNLGGIIFTLNDLTGNISLVSSNSSVNITTANNNIDLKVSITGSTSLQVVYVAQDGSDITGDGTIISPYASITFALSTITTNSAAKPYQIMVLSGVYTETTFQLKPFVSINGTGSQLTVTNPITLDPSWATGGYMFFENFLNSAFPGGINLDFGALSAAASQLYINNINTRSASSYAITGSSTAPTLVQFTGITSGLLTTQIINVSNCFGLLGQSRTGDVFITNTDIQTRDYTIADSIILGNLGVSSSNGTLNFTSSSVFVTGNGTLSNSAPGDLNGKIISTTFNSSFTLNGDSNLIVNATGLTSDAALIGSPVINYIEVASTINANYSAVHYSPTTPEVSGHLQGIDNALAPISFTAKLSSSATNVTGDGTPYPIIFDQVFSNNGLIYNNSTGVVTASVTGLYNFEFFLNQILGGTHNDCDISLVTTSKTYSVVAVNPNSVKNVSNNIRLGGSVLADMTAGDTAFVQLTISGGALDSGVYGDGTSTVFTYFSGYLVRKS